jgi:hypothetical protein
MRNKLEHTMDNSNTRVKIPLKKEVSNSLSIKANISSTRTRIIN